MTISYNLDVSSSSSWTFLKVIFRWRGSIWKSVMTELISWCILYFIITVLYRYAMPRSWQYQFEALASYMDDKLDDKIPLIFLLGFFVTKVFDRWNEIFSNIGFVDNVAFYVANYVNGDDEQTRIEKRNILRYLCLTQVLVLRDISIKVRKRFPNLDAVVDSGFLQMHEKEIMDNVDNDFNKYWLPINWIFALCIDLRRKEKIVADVLLNQLLNEVKTYNEHLRTLCNYDWVPVPLAYPQVVFLAVRVYFLVCLISRQYLIHNTNHEEKTIDLYVPLMTMLQFIFFMGWLKVAEALLNPLGEDDDDYECNYIIDRNITIALSMVEQTHEDIPKQTRDSFKAGARPLYSEETAKITVNALIGSATNFVVPGESEKVKMVPHTGSTLSLDSMDLHTKLSFRNVSKRLKKKLQVSRAQSLPVSDIERDPAPIGIENNGFDTRASSPHILETVTEEDENTKSK